MALNKHLIFLVDDDPMNNEMLKSHLEEKFKLDIKQFATGEDCIAALDQNPQYVILDFNLNSTKRDAKNGIEILKAIKEKNPDIYVVMLSGQDKIEVAIDTMRNGAYDYVVKNPSAFVRTENIIYNIHHNLRLVFAARAYKTATFVLGGFIMLAIIVAIVLKITGVSTESLGWF